MEETQKPNNFKAEFLRRSSHFRPMTLSWKDLLEKATEEDKKTEVAIEFDEDEEEEEPSPLNLCSKAITMPNLPNFTSKKEWPVVLDLSENPPSKENRETRPIVSQTLPNFRLKNDQSSVVLKEISEPQKNLVNSLSKSNVRKMAEEKENDPNVKRSLVFTKMENIMEVKTGVKIEMKATTVSKSLEFKMSTASTTVSKDILCSITPAKDIPCSAMVLKDSPCFTTVAKDIQDSIPPKTQESFHSQHSKPKEIMEPQVGVEIQNLPPHSAEERKAEQLKPGCKQKQQEIPSTQHSQAMPSYKHHRQLSSDGNYNKYSPSNANQEEQHVGHAGQQQSVEHPLWFQHTNPPKQEEMRPQDVDERSARKVAEEGRSREGQWREKGVRRSLPEQQSQPSPHTPRRPEQIHFAVPDVPKKREATRDLMVVNGNVYRVLSQIGKGGSSKVYLVLSNKHELLAVKHVKLSGVDEKTRNDYLNEIEHLLKMQHSQHVIRLYDHQYVPGNKSLFAVMERGDTDLARYLKDRASSGERISPQLILFYWSEILMAVKSIHDNNIIHRDLKPANFLLVSGRLKLIDFGIASAIQNEQTSVFKDCLSGTCNYMSPEAIQDLGSGEETIVKIGRKTDVWSLGCILYYFLYGKTPYQEFVKLDLKLRTICNPNYKVQFPKVPGVPEVLIESCRRCLEHNKDCRASVEELLHLKNQPLLSPSQVLVRIKDLVTADQYEKVAAAIQDEDATY